VTASHDKTVRVWDSETGGQVGEPLTGHTETVRSALFSPDGTCISSVDSSATIRVWKAGGSDLGKPIHVIEVSFQSQSNTIPSVSFAPLGQLIVVNIGNYTQVLDLSTGSEAAVVPPEYRDRLVCFSPDEHFILFFGRQDSNLHLWNVESCHIENVFRGHTDTVLKASFSPDGKHIVSASEDYSIRVWSTETSSQTAVYQNLGIVHEPKKLETLEVSPDGRRILSVYNGHTQIWTMPDSLPPGTNLNYSADDPNVRI